MSLNYHLLGKKIQQQRIEQKISQSTLAEMIDVSPTSISRIERGVKGLSLEKLVLIADALNTSLDRLLAESLEHPQNSNTSEIGSLLQDCSTYEKYVLFQSVKEMKRILREGETIHND